MKSRAASVKSAAGAATIADVARRAGVSTATVSRALAMPGKVAAATRDAILAAVKETSYTPNIAARNLRTNRTRTVLAILPDVTNIFFSRILRGIEHVLAQRGYSLIIADTANDPAKEQRYDEFLNAGGVDGALLLNGRALTAQVQGRLAAVGLCERIPATGLPHAGTDNRAAAKAMTKYLINLGHLRIGYLRGPARNVLEHERFNGFADALRESGIGMQPALAQPGDFSIEAGEAAAEYFAMMAKPPDAIFACNDAMAMGVIRGLTAKGLRVPADISVAGFDDIEFAAAYTPSLTTMRQQRAEIGAAATEMLLDMIEGKPLRQLEILLPAELVIRESTAPKPQRSRR